MNDKLKIFQWGHPWRYFILRPWKWFKYLFRNIKNFFMRARNGWCTYDVWMMDEYLMYVIPGMLRHLAEHSCGYPGVDPFETSNKYEDWLIQLAEKFEEIQDEDKWYKKNEYSDVFYESVRKRGMKTINKDTDFDIMTDKEREIRDKYFARMEELGKERDAKVLEAYTELAKYHNILWD